MIQERPIFGTGLESFAWRFEEKAKPGFFQHTDYYNLADRPHNEPMEMWIHLGILGLILYLVFFGLVLREAFRSRGRRHYAALAILTLLVSNFFSFSMTIHYFFLALFASFLFSDKAKAASFMFNRAGKLVSLLLLGMAASTVFWSARLMASNHQLSQAILEINENHHEKAMAIMEAALENSPPYADLYSFAFDQLYAIILRTHSEIAFGKAAEINQAYSALSQNNLKSRLNLAKIHMIGGENEKAEAAFKSIASQKAAQPLVYEYWANFYHGTGQHKKAALVYDRLLELMPRSWKSKPFEPQSLTDAQRIFWKNHPEFMVSLENAAESYSMTEQEGKAQFILSLVQ